MKKRFSVKSSIIGGILFFIDIAVIVTVAVLVYSYIADKSNGDRTLISWVMIVVIIALAGLCTLIDYIRRKITVDKPVNQILIATERIASGDFTTRLNLSTRHNYDEYYTIMDNLNKMAAELSRTEVLHTDFISNVSHEIKTPLAIIQNYAKLLLSKNLDKETHDKYASTLVAASEKLTNLVSNILKLNKLENQEIQTDIEEINLSEMLAQTLLNYEDRIEEKSLNINCDLQENVMIKSSSSYLEIIWNNLISNAIKFTDKGGEISLSLKKENSDITVEIKDTGCGISTKTGNHIFEKFYQGDTSHAQEGNGLGLALVKKVIDIIGGTIKVNSELGKGSTFVIKLKSE